MAAKAPSWLKGFASKSQKKAKTGSGAATPLALEGKGGGSSGGDGAGGDEGYDYMCDSLLPSHPAPRMQQTLEEELRSQPVSKKRALDEGLSQPIGTENLGFKMLAKMGFKGEGGLGREGGGLAAPLDVTLKAGRAGLGVDEAKTRERKEFKAMAGVRKSEREDSIASMRDTFMGRQRAAFAAKKAAGDLQRAERVCEQLDRASGVQESPLWGRPEGPDGTCPKGEMRSFAAPDGQVYYKRVLRRAEAEAENVPEEVCLSGEEVLLAFRAVVRHLREQHCYCFGCAGRFGSEDELEGHCQADEECMQLYRESSPHRNADEIDLSDI